MNGQNTDSSTLNSARELITGSGLPMPPVPRAVAEKLQRPQGAFYFTTREDTPGPWDLGWFLAEIEQKTPADYLVLGLDGHGTESKAAHYYLVAEELAVFHQSSLGSPANPEPEQTLSEQYDLIAIMAVAISQAREKGQLPPCARMVLVRPAYLQPFWGIQPAPGQPVDWQDATDPLLEACGWLADRLE